METPSTLRLRRESKLHHYPVVWFGCRYIAVVLSYGVWFKSAIYTSRFTVLKRGFNEIDLIMSDKPLFIPVILGTVRKGRASKNVARFVFEQVQQREGVETEFIDICDLNFRADDAGEHIKNAKFSESCERADGLVLVVPEYNHGYPGMLKHALDSNLKEYIHKPVGICGVSAGGFGGTRVIENLLPVLRELGLVTIFWDGNFSGAQKLFDANGKIIDEPTHAKRIDKFLGELIWMSKVLRHGRENISI